MRHVLFTIIFLLNATALFAVKTYAPNSSASISGTGSYCISSSASPISFTYNTCNSGVGSSVGVSLTVTWYKNTTNSTTGGTAVATSTTTCAMSGSGTVTYTPATSSAGTLYYYCQLTWSGSGTCRGTGTLTSASAVPVNIIGTPGAISGTTTLCSGTSTTLTNTTINGTWTTNAPSVASINAVTGAVSGISAGTAAITYTTGCGTDATATVTINRTPSAISGASRICRGASTSLTDATIGGTWSTSNASIVSINSTGMAYGVNAGNATITYSDAGCSATKNISVDTSVTAGTLSGSSYVCVGSIAAVTSDASGGTWYSSDTTLATIDATGLIDGLNSGDVTITYTVANGCGTSTTTTDIAVLPLPLVDLISGATTTCAGSTVTLSDTTTGGIWSTDDATIASIDASGNVYAMSTGTTGITYTKTTVCGTDYAFVSFTVTPSMYATITGPDTICNGSSGSLTASTTGGSWSTLTPATATIDATGSVTGLSSGWAVLMYTLHGTCGTAIAYDTLYVNDLPIMATITGGATLCTGTVATLSCATPGGSWSSSNSMVATVDAGGVANALSPGSTTVAYSISNSCGTSSSTLPLTVNNTPAPITGTHNLCLGYMTTLRCATPGGTWSTTRGTGRLTVDSTGLVVAILNGTASVEYTVGGCTVSHAITVAANPSPITGSSTVCEGSTLALANSTAGGTWSCSDYTIASVSGVGGSGTVNALSSGTANITYTTGFCYVYKPITVSTAPSPIAGPAAVCLGGSVNLTNLVSGGTWGSISGTGSISISTTGTVTGIRYGTATAHYTIGACRVSLPMIVNNGPAPISGPSSMCSGTSATFIDTSASGMWSSSNPSVVTINTGGIAYAISAGTATITYSIGSCYKTKAVTVGTSPASIAGTATLCSGTTTTLTNSVSGGTWSRTNGTGSITINTAGLVTATRAGTATVSYTIGSCRATLPITVNVAPSTVGGSSTLCTGLTTLYTNSVSGGSWTSSNNSVATVNSSGTVTGVAAGSSVITYATGSCFKTKTITVSNSPAPIAGTSTICNSTSTTLTNTTSGGTWSRTNGTGAINITTAGVVTGVTAGTATVSYTLGSCRSTFGVTVTPNPATIAGATSVCTDNTTTFTNTVSGGTWSSNNPTIATAGSTGNIYGVTAGATTITYGIGSCYKTKSITVNNSPAAITGASSVCTGSSTTLSNSTTGGTWSLVNGTGTGTINTLGSFSGLTAGTVTVSYTTGSCAATRVMTVIGAPGAISGTTNTCQGSTGTLANPTTGGTWTTANVAVASVNPATGTVYGVAVGTTTISYGTGCLSPATAAYTVNGTPTVTPGTIPDVVSGTRATSFTYTTTGGATTYNISWNAAALAAGFTNTSGAAVSASPISIALPNAEGSYTGSMTVTNGTCSSNPVILTANITGQKIYNFAGNRSRGYYGDNDAAVLAEMTNPYDVATDNKGNVYIADYENSVVRKVAATGIITTVAGNNTSGYSGDGGAATAAQLAHPISVVTDNNGNLFIADHDNHVVRKVDSNGIITTVAGNHTRGFSGDGGAAVSASLNYPKGVEVDGFGNLYILDYINLRIRKVDASGTISTIAGNGIAGYSGDGGPATAAKLGNPLQFVADAAGNLYIPDYDNQVIRKVNTSGTITTIAGTTAIGFSGDGGPATAATFNYPFGIALDAAGNLYVSEKYNHTVRKINTTGTISTITGWGGIAGYYGDGGLATAAKLYQPMGLAVDTLNRVYIADNANLLVRIIGEQNRTPFFPAGTIQTVNICRNATAFSLDSLLAGRDLDTAQTINWSVLSSPTHGRLATGGSTATSNGSVLGVSGYTYTPDTGYTGTDSLVLAITDGNTTSQTKIRINILGDPDPGAITGGNLVCLTATLNLTNTATGGTWASSNPSVATITPALGYLSGMAIGTVTITYRVTTACGTSFTTSTVNVVDYPSASVSAATPCTGHATNIIVTGTARDTVKYSLNGGAYRDTVITAGTLNFPTPSLTGSYTFRLVSIRNSSCQTNIDRLLTINPMAMVWQGGTAGAERNWYTANNWSCGTVPTVSDNISVPSGLAYFPTLASGDTGYVNNVTIAYYGAMTLDSNALLYVKGNITNDNDIKGKGRIMMNGSSAQTISGVGRLGSLEINNASGVSIGSRSKQTIRGVLTMTNGNFNTNDSLVLGSDSTGSARVAPIVSGTINGTVRVMQYIPGGYRRYRFYSHPFTNDIPLSQMQNYIDVTGVGGASNGFTTTGTNAASAFRYNPLVANSTMGYDPGWREFTSCYGTTDSNKFKRYQGIRLFVRGSKGEGLGYGTYTPSAATIGQWGQLNQGRQLVRMAKGTSANQDYNLLGNPYASPVDIGTVLYNAKETGNITGTAFYVWNPYLGTGGQFVTVTIGSTSATPYYLPAHTAFEVRAAHNNDTLVFNESNKSATTSAALLKTAPEYVALNVYDEDYNLYDMLKIKFDDNASDVEESKYDAGKAMGPDLNFYSISADNNKLALDVRRYEADKTIKLGITSNTMNALLIKADQVTIPAGATLYLHDKLNDSYTELTAGSEYRFSITKDAKTQGNDRFELSMKPAALSNEATAMVTVSPNPATEDVKLQFSMPGNEEVHINMTDVSGVSVYQLTSKNNSGTVTVPVNRLASGMYMITINSGDHKVVKRLVKE